MKFINSKNSFALNLKSILLKLGFLFTMTQLTTPKVMAAEEILVNYGPLQFPLSIETLRVYAEEGEITEELASYADLLTPQQLETLRTGLLVKPDIEPLSISQFFYSYQGEKLLERVGQIVRTQAGQPGFYAIRSALILAAASEEGLTPLNFLETFPTAGIQVDSRQGFQFIEELSGIIQTTEKAIAAIEEEALVEAAQEVQNFPEGINGDGNFAYDRTTLSLKDESRDRNFAVDLYLPKRNLNDRPFSLIVISHGLGSDRSTFAYLARYLASYGFAVAIPEHPGSNAEQIQNLLDGFANDVTPAAEFIDRPLDITYLLDRLEAQYGSIINTEDVGIIGQSFGGYTALALAGAELNFSALDTACDNLDKSFNVSLFLQCLALELPTEETPIDLSDPRIISAIAINPLTSAIFGEVGISKIEIPVMLVSGSADPVTPALPEQIKPFTWLDVAEKYLVLMKGGTHFSVLNESSGSVPVPAAAIGPDPQVGQNYLKQLALLFFSDRYYAQNPQFGSLSASYAASISQPIMPLSLIKSLDEDKIEILFR
jgi:predicted dienelactone hydrolase